MSRRLIVRDEVEADITEAALWYEEREKGLGLEFTLEVRAAIRRAVENPLFYLRMRRRPEVRRIFVSGETKVEKTWRFEIPCSSAAVFFNFQPKPLLPSSSPGTGATPSPNDANSVPGFFGNFKTADFGNFAPPLTILARRFPYRIFFIVREDAIVVFAVIHAARHDRHWRRRI